MKPTTTTAKRAVFTDRYLKSLKPADSGRRVVHWDEAKASFGCRITDKGAVSFFVMRRMPGKPQPVRVVLGTYPTVTLAEARKLATEALGDLVSGVHPKEREREERRAKEERVRDLRLAALKRQQHTFAALADQYIRRRAAQKRTAREIKRIVGRYLLEPWGARIVTDIKRADVAALVDAIGERSGPYAGRQAHTYAAAIFEYGAGLEFGGLEVNPARGVRPDGIVGKAKKRQRVLTDEELGKVWKAARWEMGDKSKPGFNFPAGPFVHLLILTGARRAEVANMTWSEVDLDAGLWTLSGSRTKNEQGEVKPLSAMAVELLRSLPRFTTGDHVLTSSHGRLGFQAFSSCKRSIDERVPELGDWRLHDLRRTMRTGLGRLQVPVFIAELCIGHQQSGVHGVYDLHRYEDDKRDALERWASKVRSIVEPPPKNVVELARRARQ